MGFRTPLRTKLAPELTAPWTVSTAAFGSSLIALVPRLDFNGSELNVMPQAVASKLGTLLIAAGEPVPPSIHQALAVMLLDATDDSPRSFDLAGRALSIYLVDRSPRRAEIAADATWQQSLAMASTIILERYVGHGLDQIRLKDLRCAAMIWGSLPDDVARSQSAARVPDVLWAAVRRMVADGFEVPTAQISYTFVIRLLVRHGRLREAVESHGLVETMILAWSTEWGEEAAKGAPVPRTMR